MVRQPACDIAGARRAFRGADAKNCQGVQLLRDNNGCLAGYLVEHEYLGSETVDVRVGQGYEIDRPSQLYLRAARDGDAIDVNVGGKVRVVADGTLRLE